MRINPEALARASSRHPWRTLGVWLVVIIAAGMLSGVGLSGVLNQDIAFTNKPESVRAQDILDARFTVGGNKADSTEFFVIQSASSTVDDPQFQTRVTALQGQIASILPEESGVKVRGAENSIVLTGTVTDAVRLDHELLCREAPLDIARLDVLGGRDKAVDQRQMRLDEPLPNQEAHSAQNGQ